MFKRFKLAYLIYNIFQYKYLKYLIPLYKKYGLNKYYFSSISSKDFKNIKHQNHFQGRIEEHPTFHTLKDELKNQIKNWDSNGFIVLKGFFKDDVKKINETIDQLIKLKKIKLKFNTRYMFSIHKSDYIRSIAQNKILLSILEMLTQSKLDLFSSINFIHGSQQRAHSDTYHMTTFPENKIIAAWIALENVSESNGTLFYYPGSHLLPVILNEDINNEGNKFLLGQHDYSKYEDAIENLVIEHQLKKEILMAESGDVLIWHSNLIHGGLPVKEKNSTRKSMVFHYYPQDAICFHEITQRPTLKKITQQK